MARAPLSFRAAVTGSEAVPAGVPSLTCSARLVLHPLGAIRACASIRVSEMAFPGVNAAATAFVFETANGTYVFHIWLPAGPMGPCGPIGPWAPVAPCGP